MKSKYLYTKAEKILSYRKKYSAVRHEYFVMAQKYMSYNKVLLTFTVPTDIKEKSIKNGRYSKLRKLIKIRAYIAKLLNNSSDTKYFMNIELGEHYSNPHLHLQLWIKNDNHKTIESFEKSFYEVNKYLSPWLSFFGNKKVIDNIDTGLDFNESIILGISKNKPSASTSSTIANIYDKTIKKFDLNKNRCYITGPTHAIPTYNYIIKDYAKDLTDKQIWDLETQKKRFRKIMDSKVRFYSKSKDSYCKSIYRKLWYGLGIAREKANEFLDFFINKFFFFNKRNLPKISSLVIKFSILSYKEQEEFLFVLHRMFLYIAIYVFAPCLDPPGLLFAYL